MKRINILEILILVGTVLLTVGVFMNVVSHANRVTVTAEVRNPYDPISTVEAPQQAMTVEHQSDLLNLELR